MRVEPRAARLGVEVQSLERQDAVPLGEGKISRDAVRVETRGVHDVAGGDCPCRRAHLGSREPDVGRAGRHPNPGAVHVAAQRVEHLSGVDRGGRGGEQRSLARLHAGLDAPRFVEG